MSGVTIGHTPPVRKGGYSPTLASLEALLADWFDAHVVLTSSGRGAMLLWLTSVGLNRYRDRIALPRMISACVLDAVIRCGFPLDAARDSTADATIFYHQYGYTQSVRPQGERILEDICHAFFATEATGARDFVGQAAIFSLPKFFGLQSMAGGLVTRDSSLATRLRALHDEAPVPSPATRARHRRILRRYAAHGDVGIETVYLERLTNPRIADDELAGAPATLADIRAIGARRRAVMDEILSFFPANRLPGDWRALLAGSLPFLFPVFGAQEELMAANAFLAENRISAGVYQIDERRNMFAPALRPALLLPCHDGVSQKALAIFAAMAKGL